MQRPHQPVDHQGIHLPGNIVETVTPVFDFNELSAVTSLIGDSPCRALRDPCVSPSMQHQ